MGEKANKQKKPIYKKWWVWLIAIVVIGAIGAQGESEDGAAQDEKIPVSAPAESDEKKSEEKPKAEEKPKEEKPKEEVIAISATDLFAAYNDNEVAADQKYKGKQLEVTGTITDIAKDILDNMYVSLDGGEMLSSIQVYFEKGQEDAVAALSKGQELTVVGKGDGFLIMTVTLKKSQIK